MCGPAVESRWHPVRSRIKLYPAPARQKDLGPGMSIPHSNLPEAGERIVLTRGKTGHQAGRYALATAEYDKGRGKVLTITALAPQEKIGDGVFPVRRGRYLQVVLI